MHPSHPIITGYLCWWECERPAHHIEYRDEILYVTTYRNSYVTTGEKFFLQADILLWHDHLGVDCSSVEKRRHVVFASGSPALPSQMPCIFLPPCCPDPISMPELVPWEDLHLIRLWKPQLSFSSSCYCGSQVRGIQDNSAGPWKLCPCCLIFLGAFLPKYKN